MVVALDERRRERAAWAWATTGGADYWLVRDGLATPTLREQRTGSRRPRPGRDGLVTPTLRGRPARGACDETATCEWHPPCLLAARGGVTRVRRHDVAACVGSVALGVTHFYNIMVSSRVFGRIFFTKDLDYKVVRYHQKHHHIGHYMVNL